VQVGHDIGFVVAVFAQLAAGGQSAARVNVGPVESERIARYFWSIERRAIIELNDGRMARLLRQRADFTRDRPPFFRGEIGVANDAPWNGLWQNEMDACAPHRFREIRGFANLMACPSVDDDGERGWNAQTREERNSHQHTTITSRTTLGVMNHFIGTGEGESNAGGGVLGQQGHDALQVPRVADKGVGEAARRDTGDDVVEAPVNERFATGETDAKRAGPKRYCVVEHAFDQLGLELLNANHIVPDAMRASEVTVAGDGKAKNHDLIAEETND